MNIYNSIKNYITNIMKNEDIKCIVDNLNEKFKILNTSENINTIAEKKIKIMGINYDKINDFEKQLLVNDNKFMDYLNLKCFIKGETTMDLYEKYCKMLNIYTKNDFAKKINYYKNITNALGIKNNIEFDYYTDEKKFKEKLNNKDIIENINNIKEIFNIRGNKYKDFDREGGYEKMYKLAVSICKQIFGNELINSKESSKNENNKKVKVIKYCINKKYYEKIKLLCSNDEYIEIDDL